MSFIELGKPDGKSQIIYNNYKFSRTSNPKVAAKILDDVIRKFKSDLIF
jgi:hypothetical protein